MKNFIIIAIAIFSIGCGGGSSTGSPENEKESLDSVEVIAGQKLPKKIPSDLKNIAKMHIDSK